MHWIRGCAGCVCGQLVRVLGGAVADGAGDVKVFEPTVGLTIKTSQSENVLKFGQPPACCLPTARHEHNVVCFVWRRCAGGHRGYTTVPCSAEVYFVLDLNALCSMFV